MVVLLVDAANVVGARPDGWWRDRSAATSRLLVRLTALPGRIVPAPGGGRLLCGEVVAVVEGTASTVRAPAGVTLVRAGGIGDDALASHATRLAEEGRRLLVVTADRGLRARLPPSAMVTGPGWLYDVLPA